MPPISSEQRSPYPGRNVGMPAADAASGSDHNPSHFGARGPPADPEILLENEVVAIVRLSTVTLWRLEKRGAFPRRIKLGGKRVGWLKHEILEWVADLMAARAA